jgi:intron-binding protein aquarius
MDHGDTPPHRNGTVPLMTSQGDPTLLKSLPASHSRPTVEDLQGNNYYAETARKVWLNTQKPPKVLPAVVKQIWDNLQKDGFAYGPLLVLETLQVLEK